MPKRVTEEETIVAFFSNHEDLSKIETVFNIVKGVMKRRLGTRAANGQSKPKATGSGTASGTKRKGQSQSSSAQAAPPQTGDPEPLPM